MSWILTSKFEQDCLDEYVRESVLTEVTSEDVGKIFHVTGEVDYIGDGKTYTSWHKISDGSAGGISGDWLELPNDEIPCAMKCDTKPEGTEGTVENYCGWKSDHDAKVASIEARLQKAKDRNAAGSAARAELADKQIPSEKWKEKHKEKTDAQCERIGEGCSEDTQVCEGVWGAGAGDASGPYLANLPRAENISGKQAKRDDVKNPERDYWGDKYFPWYEMFYWDNGGHHGLGGGLFVVSNGFLKWCGNYFSPIYPHPMSTEGIGAMAGSVWGGLYNTKLEALDNHPMPFRFTYGGGWAEATTLEKAKASGNIPTVYEYHGEGTMAGLLNPDLFIVWEASEEELECMANGNWIDGACSE